MDEVTMQLTQEQSGFLGYESVINGNKGIFKSYWESMDAINYWRHNATHLMAK